MSVSPVLSACDGILGIFLLQLYGYLHILLLIFAYFCSNFPIYYKFHKVILILNFPLVFQFHHILIFLYDFCNCYIHNVFRTVLEIPVVYEFIKKKIMDYLIILLYTILLNHKYYFQIARLPFSTSTI